jgi:hypothetical protein
MDYMKSFIRHPGGIWECTAAAEFNSPSGRIQVAPGTRFSRGTMFMGVDIAAWLDEQHQRTARRD